MTSKNKNNTLPVRWKQITKKKTDQPCQLNISSRLICALIRRQSSPSSVKERMIPTMNQLSIYHCFCHLLQHPPSPHCFPCQSAEWPADSPGNQKQLPRSSDQLCSKTRPPTYRRILLKTVHFPPLGSRLGRSEKSQFLHLGVPEENALYHLGLALEIHLNLLEYEQFSKFLQGNRSRFHSGLDISFAVSPYQIYKNVKKQSSFFGKYCT